VGLQEVRGIVAVPNLQVVVCFCLEVEVIIRQTFLYVNDGWGPT